jgi:TolA-binding protein
MYKSYKDEDIYISLADCYFNDKDYGKSLVVYKDYFVEYPNGERELDASYGMVQTLYQLKDFNSAKELAKQVDDKYGIGLLKELEAKIKFKKETVSE